MNMKYTTKPTYEEVDVKAKTVDTVSGTADRKTVGRCLLTEAAGFDGKHVVVDGDGTSIVTVKPFGGEADEVKEIEVFVELAGGVKSLASFKFYAGWTADNRENAGVKDVFTKAGDTVARVVDCAKRMCMAHPECDSQWKIMDKDGRRVFLRLVADSLTPTGRVGNE